jgi:hypothetical protein
MNMQALLRELDEDEKSQQERKVSRKAKKKGEEKASLALKSLVAAFHSGLFDLYPFTPHPSRKANHQEASWQS